MRVAFSTVGSPDPTPEVVARGEGAALSGTQSGALCSFGTHQGLGSHAPTRAVVASRDSAAHSVPRHPLAGSPTKYRCSSWCTLGPRIERPWQRAAATLHEASAP